MSEFYRVYKGIARKDARESLDRLYSTGLAFGGDKKSIDKYVQPHLDLLNYIENVPEEQRYEEQLSKVTDELRSLFG